MSRKILIDGAHPEELRVVVCENNKIEEVDYQTSFKQSIKGNVYLAKVERVEAALQVAFVNYGGNRHGFLPLAEIHPDYYQIPAADKEALLKQMQEMAAPRAEPTPEAATTTENSSEEGNTEEAAPEINEADSNPNIDEPAVIRPDFYKKYRIQEVIKKDQVILVQVVKEERGNKGASLTTYLSLAGRYCVLMPNSTRAGGVSRKITDQADRARLRDLVEEFHVKSEGMASVVIRTAGAHKTKAEIRKDYDYLSRLWNNIREHTLASQAPAFIHEEGDVIKRTIRDVYDSDIDDIIISGEEAYTSALNFMKIILPRHTTKIKKHVDDIPLFSKYGIEAQVSGLYNNIAQLESGGYLVITATEALVSIDVNSGRATRERNVENTALRTNIEAAQEAARQIMLRDLSGLIVIDFIDMGEMKNRRTVETAFRNHMARDRARLQIGKISNLGLLELSRQRLKHSFLEYSMQQCENCHGRGSVRAVGATAIIILRAIQDELARSKNKITELRVTANEKLVFYLLNDKRKELVGLEEHHRTKIVLGVDAEAGSDGFFIEPIEAVINKGPSALSAIDDAPYQKTTASLEQDGVVAADEAAAKEGKRDKKNRRRKGGRRPNEQLSSEDKVKEAMPVTDVRPDANVREEKKPQHNNKQANKRSRHKRPDKMTGNAEVPMPIEVDTSEADNFEQDMHHKQQQNQSLLREIWKKIVE